MFETSNQRPIDLEAAILTTKVTRPLVCGEGLIFLCLILGNYHIRVVESLCVDWRKALRSLWHVDPKTHCDLITTVSDQIPLILSLNIFNQIYLCMFKYF